MAQNENITLSLGDKIDILNKTQSLDARYGVYDSEIDALVAMQNYGLDGRQVAVYTDKPNGKVRLYLYNGVLHQLEPISGVEVEWGDIGGDQSDVNISGFTNDSGFTTNEGTVTSVALSAPTGFDISGSPVTTTGTLTFDYSSGYQAYTTTEANKLSGIEAGAEVNVNADWNSSSGDSQILNKPTIPTKTSDLINDGADDTSTYVEFNDLAPVATSNDYNDLDNLPNSGDIGYDNTASGLDATNVQDAIDEISEIPVLTNDDNTLIIDDDIIRLNVTNITEEFTANGVDRNFEMTNVYTSIENVFINGVRIKSSDYITISEQEIEIKTTVSLLLGDEVVIQGTMFVVE
jgi:hypothetical protein